MFDHMLIESIIPSQPLDHPVLSRQELMELQHACSEQSVSVCGAQA